MSALLERLETAKTGSREMSAHIVKALLAPAEAWVEQSRFNGAWCIYERPEKPRLWDPDGPLRGASVTESLDAALTLAGLVVPTYTATLVIYRTNGGEFPPHALANLLCPYGEITEYRGDAKTAPLALCAAILKAKGAASTDAVGMERSGMNPDQPASHGEGGA